MITIDNSFAVRIVIEGGQVFTNDSSIWCADLRKRRTRRKKKDDKILVSAFGRLACGRVSSPRLYRLSTFLKITVLLEY